LAGVKQYLRIDDNLYGVWYNVSYIQVYPQILGKTMEFKPYKGDVADLKALRVYLDSVTILINTLKQTYGV
jgi:hypothetical protein